VTEERFQELAEAYGGDVARWPPALRDEAAVLAAARPGFAQGVLTRASRLDALLDDVKLRPASVAQFEHIVASAPALRQRTHWRLWALPAGLSAALAGVAAVGVLLGAQVGAQSSVATVGSTQSVADLDVTTVGELG